jgi:NAD(P)-dependent dehydrogenase (short-subunit alcohol dehydrogenase family)
MNAETSSNGRRLAGRKVLITGAASGIGRATAILFAAEGAKLALLDCNDAGLNQTAQDTGAWTETVDLLETQRVPGAVQRAAEAMGGLDGVVNCAGVSDSAPLADMAPEIWAKVIGVNLTAPYLVCRAALPYLRQAKEASVVNIASGQGLLPSGGASAYSASKAGLMGLSRDMAAELGPTIRVNVIVPGVTNTPMIKGLVGAYPNPNDAPFVKQLGLKRIAQPEEVARGILFLISSEASFVTGITLPVDGGRTYH